MDFYLDSLLHLPYVTVDGYKEVDGTVVLKLRYLNETICCPGCGASLDEIHQVEYILIRDLPVFGKPIYLQVPRRQFHCQECQRFWTERLSFVDWQHHYTQRYEQAIYEQVKQSSIEVVSRVEWASASSVRAIFKGQAVARVKKSSACPDV
ncbi:transposase family protein [Leptolyngbya sp. PL-A3]|uniref:transposase family protein n=1 Tax=Leptolyngbya sp. PL-A3 TaxID=2933911 RepID=UPI003298998A